jgi:hypothetical protein
MQCILQAVVLSSPLERSLRLILQAVLVQCSVELHWQCRLCWCSAVLEQCVSESAAYAYATVAPQHT